MSGARVRSRFGGRDARPTLAIFAGERKVINCVHCEQKQTVPKEQMLDALLPGCSGP